MNVAISVRLVVGTVEEPVLPEQARREGTTYVEGVVGPIRRAHFCRWYQRGSLRLQRNRSTKGTVAICRCSHAALYLHRAYQRCIGVHVCPEHTLVLGRIQGYTVEGDVDARVAGTANAQIGGSRSQSVLAPGQHAGCA